MDGKNSSPNVYIFLITVIIICLYALLDTITSTGQKAHGRVVEKKAPAAICRKVANACDEDSIEVWGDGEQTRSFLYIDECIEATRRLMESDCTEPINIGSEEMVTINQLVDIAAEIAGKKITKEHIDGPLGVRGRNSNNDLIREKLGWDYEMTLEEGMKKTYEWVRWQVSKQIYSVV